MPGPLSPNLRKMIVLDYLWGFGRNESAKKLRRYKKTLAPNSVTNVRDEFDNRVEEMGIHAAAEEYGVSSQVAELRKVGEFATANKIELCSILGENLIMALSSIVNPLCETLEQVISNILGRHPIQAASSIG